MSIAVSLSMFVSVSVLFVSVLFVFVSASVSVYMPVCVCARACVCVCVYFYTHCAWLRMHGGGARGAYSFSSIEKLCVGGSVVEIMQEGLHRTSTDASFHFGPARNTVVRSVACTRGRFH